MNRWIIFPALFLLAQSTEQPEPRYFRYQRSLTASDAVGGQSCATLDATVFTHAARDLSDLRVYNGAQEVPFAIDMGIGPNTASYAAPTVLNRGVRDGKVVFDVHLLHPSYSKISLDIDKKDFIASVDVSGSAIADGSASTHLGTFAVFDLTNQQLTRSTVLNLPVSNFPYLHFTITGPLKPEEILGVAVLEAPQRPLAYYTVAEAHSMIRDGRKSTATFTVPSRIPVEHAEIIPAPTTGNFSRRMVVEANRATGPSPERFAGDIFRVHTVQGGLRIDQEQYAYDFFGTVADTGTTQWTVAIDNGDDVPLPVQSVRLGMRERRLCFDATPGVAYTLFYGDSALRTPRYDYAKLYRAIERPASVVLGPEQPNPAFEQRPDARPLTERYPALLWIALILVIAGLGAIALRSANRMKLSAEPGEMPGESRRDS